MAQKDSKRTGRLLIIGGAEDPDEDNMKILPHLVEMAGGKSARIIVCSTPSEMAEEKARVYHKLFNRIGVSEVVEAAITDRREAAEPQLLQALEKATAVFFTGGDQLRLTSVIAGTEFSERVRERVFRGRLVVAGTSAGAAAMSSTMIIGGPSSGTVRRSDVDLAPGLGYWRDTVVDTHFNQRGRVHRLLTLFAQNPQTLGIGIDENTAVDLTPGKRFTVLGEGTVMVFDGRVSHTSAPDVGNDEPVAITDSILHVLTETYGYDLLKLRPLLPSGREIEAVGAVEG